MAARKNVPAAEVRTWLKSEAGAKAIADYNAKADAKAVVTAHVGDRGRLHPVHQTLFAQAHKGKQYVTGVAEVPTREFKYRATDKRGRTITKVARLTLSEARTLLGTPDSKARLDAAAVVTALEAQAGFVAKPEAKVEKSEGSVAKD